MPDDRLFFILTYLKTYSLQVVHGRLFGMGQSKANQWIHVLLPALLAALRTLGDAPTRSLAALAQRLGVSAVDMATVITPLEEEPVPLGVVPATVPASPLVPMTAPSDVRRLRIEHVNSSVKRCRVVKDRLRLWKQGVHDLVMELCCALHNFRLRLTPWQPMV